MRVAAGNAQNQGKEPQRLRNFWWPEARTTQVRPMQNRGVIWFSDEENSKEKMVELAVCKARQGMEIGESSRSGPLQLINLPNKLKRQSKLRIKFFLLMNGHK